MSVEISQVQLASTFDFWRKEFNKTVDAVVQISDIVDLSGNGSFVSLSSSGDTTLGSSNSNLTTVNGRLVTTQGIDIKGSTVKIADTDNGIGFEKDTTYGSKHFITFNDGGGNFNFRVGNKFSQNSHVSTEAGTAFHDVWNQGTLEQGGNPEVIGFKEFNISDSGKAVGQNINWRTQIRYDRNEVAISYQGSQKLKTTLEGVSVTGQVTASDFNTTSDLRLKENVETAAGLETVSALRGVVFDYKEDGKHASGVIAQEVEDVIPHAVSEKGGVKVVAYQQIIGHLIEAVKELKEEVETLKTKK